MAALGAQVRDGFALGVKDLGGKMAGREVELISVDDELKPDGAVIVGHSAGGWGALALTGQPDAPIWVPATWQL